jgi:ABC-2 type transport system permease protein
MTRIREFLRYRSFVKNLVSKDLKLKYRDSVLGVAWSLLNPLLTLGVYTLAFKHIMRIQIEHYPYFLLTGLLSWQFFSSALLGSTGAIVGNAHLIRKVYFPRETLPVATVLFAFAQFLLALAVFVPALVLVSGVSVRWTVLLLPLVLLVHFAFALGLAFGLSAVTTSFRDVAHLTEVATLLLFWLTPIVYPVAMAPAMLQAFFTASPLAAFAIAYQDLLFWGRVPDAVVIATTLGWSAAALFVGHRVFRWYRPTFAEAV